MRTNKKTGNGMKQNKLTRYAIACAALVGALFLSGCSPKVVDFRNIEISNGIVYERGANEGFTGKITNVPDGKLLSSQKGLPSFWTPIKAVLVPGNSKYFDVVFFTSSLCDANVRKGVLDGDVTCMQPQSKILRYQMSFADGALDGAFKLYDLSANKNVVSHATFKGGQISGKQETFSLKTQKLIHYFNWDKGVAEGAEEGFDENTGNLKFSAGYKNGKINGDIINYAPDGKLVIYRAAYVAGLQHGVQEQFDVETGKPRLYAEWTNGVRSGASVKEWDASGKSLTDATAGPSSSEIVMCVDRWILAFRKEQGGDAAVSMDQMGEWESWCKQGKKPG